MFKVGDKIVHQRHGAGTVIEPRTIDHDGQTREYFCIELSGDRGLLMVPRENVNEDEMRPALTDTDVIAAVLQKPPQELGNDHRVRQNTIRAKIKTRDPRQLAQALRDLCWREHTDKLTYTDSQLKDQVQRLLTQELALNPSLTPDAVRNRLNQMVKAAIAQHAEQHTD
jgi:RNA polymerase-interacting CarD/CdnL/TRCF family regulator